ncbi:PDPFL protein [Pseudomonas serboccidentalis]
MWRGGLPPFGGAAVVIPDSTVYLKYRDVWVWGRFAAQRGQAPSPQVLCLQLDTCTNKNAAILSRRFCVCGVYPRFLPSNA